MVAEGSGIISHAGHQLQLAAGLARSSAKRGPHAVVASIEDQHRTLIPARSLPLRDQPCQAREPTSGSIVIELKRGVVRPRAHPDEGRVHIVGMQDGEGLIHLFSSPTRTVL